MRLCGNAIRVGSGLVQIAKMLGFYEPEVLQVGVSPENDHLKAKFAAMSDDELISIIEG